MTTELITEPVWPAEFIISEAPGSRSRDEITVGVSQSLNPGTVLGYSDVGALAAAYAALDTNTGNFTCGSITVAAGTPLGEYDGVMGNATEFALYAPHGEGPGVGEEVGHGVLGTAFNLGGLDFTLIAGGVAAVADDSFKITVTQSGALDVWLRWNPAATDGSQNAGAISFGNLVTGTATTAVGAAITRDAEVKSGVLDWGSGNVTQIAAATVQLANEGIIVR